MKTKVFQCVERGLMGELVSVSEIEIQVPSFCLMFRHFLYGFQSTDLSQRNIFFKLKGHFETSQNGGNHCVDDAHAGFFKILIHPREINF